jgi:hypothetical protein
MSLVYAIPQLAVVMIVYKLVINDLIHIIVEPLGKPENIDNAVIEAVRHYSAVYKMPASIEDIGLYVYVRPVRDIIDRALTTERIAKIKETAEKLVAEGKLRKTEYGYEPVA